VSESAELQPGDKVAPWTVERALAFAENAEPNADLHPEDPQPDFAAGVVRVFFARDRGAGAECPWCVLGCCTQLVNVMRGGAELVVHGRRGPVV
jgi:hypothetical protein